MEKDLCKYNENVEVINKLEDQPELSLIGLNKDNWIVCCNGCYATGGVRRTAVEAVEAWDRRANDENSRKHQNRRC
jgi:hypothetical protein